MADPVLGASTPFAPPAADAVVAYRGATVLDGTGAPAGRA